MRIASRRKRLSAANQCAQESDKIGSFRIQLAVLKGYDVSVRRYHMLNPILPACARWLTEPVASVYECGCPEYRPRDMRSLHLAKASAINECQIWSVSNALF